MLINVFHLANHGTFIEICQTRTRRKILMIEEAAHLYIQQRTRKSIFRRLFSLKAHLHNQFQHHRVKVERKIHQPQRNTDRGRAESYQCAYNRNKDLNRTSRIRTCISHIAYVHIRHSYGLGHHSEGKVLQIRGFLNM